MYPVIFEIPIFGGIRIYTYGILVAIAFVAGILWTARQGQRIGIPRDKIFDLSFYIILASLAGSRILYILAEWKHYLPHPLDILKIWEGGLIFYGGLIGAILTSLYYMKQHQLKFLQVADLFMPGLALGHAIGRLGCLASGCCYGREAFDVAWAITFPNRPYSLAPAGIPLYPTQLMESGASLLIFFALLWCQQKKRFDGQLFLIYLILYSVTRAFLETFRGAAARTFLVPHWFTASQLISALLVVIAITWYLKLKRL